MTYNDKTILITGGTGSFGNCIVPYLLENFKPKKVIIFSRDEMKQWHMQKMFRNYDNVRFFIGDVRDADRLRRAFQGVDFVIHAAATKIVPTAEYNPFECIKTNIDGAKNVIDSAIDAGVQKVVALSTDKASSPVNLYGATKLVSDKSFVAGNVYSGLSRTTFSVVRYGNVMGSRGSVIPFFSGLDPDIDTPITDPRMTRFLISLPHAVDLVTHALNDMVGGEIYVKKLPSMGILDIAKAIRPDNDTTVVGIRPGEKIHEEMISLEDAPFTYEYPEHYKILPQLNDWYKTSERIKNGKIVPEDFSYSSDKNSQKMTIKELQTWIMDNRKFIGSI
jgi:UDP-N-acetylglucosamine 4,6-dehydratase/5-epimerase